MLVLTRKVGESIVVGDNIVLSVVAVSGARVRVGIEAPREIPVMRREVANDRLPARRVTERFVGRSSAALELAR
jgi:carbon storage regulator